MNTTQKIAVGILAALAWLGCIVAAHAYPDMATALAEVKVAAQGVLAGIGAYHMGQGQPDPKQ